MYVASAIRRIILSTGAATAFGSFSWGGGDRAYCQPCVSPVWDTALAADAMMETGGATRCRDPPRARLAGKAASADSRRLDGGAARFAAGGWAFQYANGHYPDLDDTAVVVWALSRFDRARSASRWTGRPNGSSECRAERRLGLVDADNTHYNLNHIPFADHGALLDPPTGDVTARCDGSWPDRRDAGTPRCRARSTICGGAGSRWKLVRPWGTNYIYGTWSVLAA